MTIQTIIDKFETNFPDKIARVIDDFGDTTKSDLKDFLKDSLTSMLDGIKEETFKLIEKVDGKGFTNDLVHAETNNECVNEVINIINSHR